MTDYTDSLGVKLNELLEKNYDAEEGFKKAAENAKLIILKTYFTNKAQERHDFSNELKFELEKFGNIADQIESLMGATPLSWMEIKSWFAVDGDDVMLAEAISGDKASVKNYIEVLNDIELPDSTKEMLEIQKNTIAHSLINIKGLEDLI